MRLVLLGALVALSACTSIRLLNLKEHRCADGLPVLILQHPGCGDDGICGYSCEPDRWKDYLTPE